MIKNIVFDMGNDLYVAVRHWCYEGVSYTGRTKKNTKSFEKKVSQI